MSGSGKKLVFIGHNAGRTGAPILLLHFLEWLAKNTSLSYEVILRSGGELLPTYSSLAPVTLLGEGFWKWLWPFLEKIGWDPNLSAWEFKRLKKLYLAAWEKKRLKKLFTDQNTSLIYANTVTNASVMSALAGLQIPVLTHVHELERVIKTVTKPREFRVVQDLTTHYIAVSDAVRQNLIVNYGVPANQIDLVNGFINVERLNDLDKTACRFNLRRQLNIPEDAFVVGGSGTTDWRKGSDLFIEIARLANLRSDVPLHFVWVGGHNSGRTFSSLRRKISQTGMENRIHFLGHQVDPHGLFAGFDVFALTSREDPFPLVMLENGALGVPIVCFRGSGGAPEFVQEDAGRSVIYEDTCAFAEALLNLMRNDELRRDMGTAAKRRVIDKHTTLIAAPLLFDILQRFIT